jgi:hypothetical protein
MSFLGSTIYAHQGIQLFNDHFVNSGKNSGK